MAFGSQEEGGCCSSSRLSMAISRLFSIALCTTRRIVPLMPGTTPINLLTGVPA
jgi:hypothetical protein